MCVEQLMISDSIQFLFRKLNVVIRSSRQNKISVVDFYTFISIVLLGHVHLGLLSIDQTQPNYPPFIDTFQTW